MADAVHEKSSYLKKVGPNLYRAPSGTYYLLVKRGSKQFRRSLRTKDLALAKRNLRAFQDKVSQLSKQSDERNLLFKELSDRWLLTKEPHLKASSFDRLKVALKGLLPHLGAHAVRSIDSSHLANWQSKRGNLLSPRSWNIEIDVLKQIFTYAKDDLKILIDDPSAKLKRRKQKGTPIVIPSKAQFGAIIAELRNGHRSTGEAADFAEFLGYSGCRKQEASAVLLKDIKWDSEILMVTGGDVGTKNHEPRAIPLFTPLQRLLKSIIASKNLNSESPIFGIKSARQQLHRACERLDLPLFGHHAMRHFFCSNAIEAGVDFKTIAEWLGHKDGGVLVAKTYGHLRAEHSRAMAQRITFDASHI